MTENKKHIIYDSSKDQYNTSLISELYLQSGCDITEEKKISQEEIIPEKIIILDNIEYMLIDIYVKNDFESVIESIMKTNLRKTYNGPIRTQILINPNTNDKDLYFKFIIIDRLHYSKKDDITTIHIYAQKRFFFLHTEDGDIGNPADIDKYILRNIITDSEKQFITELIAQQNEDILNQKKSKFNLFKINEKKKEDKKKEKELEKWDISESEKNFVNMESLRINDGILNSDAELAKLTGLINVKDEINKLKAKLKYRKVREKRGIKDNSITNLHMCFLGNPGTGKTTVARIITGLLYELGYVKTNKCIELNANELKAGYSGQTSIKTKAILRNAKNKVLFIDEAYSLYDGFQGGFGKEALDVILKEMEDNKNELIIIFAGYQEEMQDLINMNEGLKSRINRYIQFENYTPSEECEILMKFLNNKSLLITQEALEKCMLVFKNATLKRNFSNGRFARNLLEKVEEEHAFNVRKIKDTVRRDTIEIEDITDEIIKELLTQSM